MVLGLLKSLLGGKPAPMRTTPRRFVPPPGTVAEQWQAYHAFQNQGGGYRALFKPALDPFRDWNPAVCSSWQVEHDVECALALNYVGQDPEIASALLERAQAVAARIRDDSRQTKFFAHDMMRLERGEAYARWMSSGVVDVEMLARAYRFAMESAGIRAYDDENDPRDAEVANRFVRSGELLAAARIGLVAGRPADAVVALKGFRRGGSGVQDAMAEALKAAAQALSSDELVDRSAAREAISTIFDRFRPPMPTFDYREFSGESRLAAFELGVVLARLETDGPVVLDTVYRRIAAP